MQQNCSCADACESSAYTQDDSLSSFSKLSIENLLDHDTKTIGKKYKAVKEWRERVEEKRIADFLSKLLKISHGLTKFIRYTSYVASSGTASIRTLSEKAIKAFYFSVINKDIDDLFGDIENYTESYEAMYRPSRRLIEEQLAEVSDEVTYYIKMLHIWKETSYNEETFKNNVYGVAGELLKQITQAEIIVETLDYENAYSEELFYGREHWAFKPTRLFESKKLEDDCKDIRNNFTKSMETMKNITDDIIVNNSYTYTIRRVDIVDMMLTLHGVSLPLREKIKEYKSCLNCYYSFIQFVQNFRAANVHSENEEYLIWYSVRCRSETIRINQYKRSFESTWNGNCPVHKRETRDWRANKLNVGDRDGKKAGICEVISNYWSIWQDNVQDQQHKNDHVEELHSSLETHKYLARVLH